jgi:hypothetical protein
MFEVACLLGQMSEVFFNLGTVRQNAPQHFIKTEIKEFGYLQQESRREREPTYIHH